MNNLQPNYTEQPPIGQVGRIADATPATIISRVLGGSTALGFGQVVVRGTDPQNQCVSPASAGGTAFLGISLVEVATLPDTPDQYQVGDVVGILSRGCIWVLSAVNVTAGDPVYFTSAGALTNVSSSNTLIPNAKFDSTATAGAVAKLRLS